MVKSSGMRFSVHPQDEGAARAHFEQRGFRPKRAESDDSGLVVLVFPVLPEAELHALVMAAPVHLSAKTGKLVGDRPPFRPVNPNER